MPRRLLLPSEGGGREEGALKISHIKSLRENPTEAEKRLWQFLRAKQLSHIRFRRQFPIGPYIVDFVCLKRQLIVEVDGGQHASQTEADAARTEWLQRAGYEVIRFWNNDVIENIEGVLFQISNALERSSAPSSRPPPSGGGGDICGNCLS